MRSEGCWIFISHSSRDIQKIRMIRNEFEKYGQNPLAFHLKCLNTDTEQNRNELLDLIKREIESREWFVFCESSNSLSSEYVQMERDYVQKCNKKMIWEIDLNTSDEEIKGIIKQICCDLQVFISYSHRDSSLAKRISKELEKRDYYVWNEEKLKPGDFYLDTINQAISSISKKGLVLLLITENSINSTFVLADAVQAMKNGARIIAFIVGDIIKHTLQKAGFSFIFNESYRIPNIPKDEDIHYLVEIINASLYSKIQGSTRTIDEILDAENTLQEALNYERCYHTEEALYKGIDSNNLNIYEFPCCGNTVLCKKKIAPSRFRADGCKK